MSNTDMTPLRHQLKQALSVAQLTHASLLYEAKVTPAGPEYIATVAEAQNVSNLIGALKGHLLSLEEAEEEYDSAAEAREAAQERTRGTLYCPGCLHTWSWHNEDGCMVPSDGHEGSTACDCRKEKP